MDAGIPDLADYFKTEITGLRLIARAQTGRLAGLGLMIVPAGIIAAVLDSTENFALLSTLGSTTVSALPPLVAGICATIKFFLWFVVLGYWVVSGAAWVIRRIHP